VQSLAAKKLLLRRSAAHDGRVLSVAATKKGTTLWKTIVRASADAYRDILAGASAAERRAFTSLLQRIADVATR
jgi:DNA-binding MarR family transcriptional regulator